MSVALGVETVVQTRGEGKAEANRAEPEQQRDSARLSPSPSLAAPKGMRLHIGLFGRRNVGKSSLLNALVRQHVSIVSDVAGTTTDPVEKPMELLPLGPVVFIDTAGIDDEGALGALRMERTRQVLDRVDLGVLVTRTNWSPFEEEIVAELRARRAPIIVVVSKCDVSEPEQQLLGDLRARGLTVVETSATTGAGLAELRDCLVAHAPPDFLQARCIVADLVGAGEVAVLVTPIDKEAPKGRLILPQVQTIRDLLDHDAFCVVVTEKNLRRALDMLSSPPELVVTDSQAFAEVCAVTPQGVPLTSFSILLARLKGDLRAMVEGALHIDQLSAGDRVLVSEACTHHPIGEDIGRVKLPRWLAERVGGPLKLEYVQGHDFPSDLRSYRLVVLCGGCTLGRREILSRVARAQQAEVPVTNYGLAIAHCLGILPRALSPFPSLQALAARSLACTTTTTVTVS